MLGQRGDGPIWLALLPPEIDLKKMIADYRQLCMDYFSIAIRKGMVDFYCEAIKISCSRPLLT